MFLASVLSAVEAAYTDAKTLAPLVDAGLALVDPAAATALTDIEALVTAAVGAGITLVTDAKTAWATLAPSVSATIAAAKAVAPAASVTA